MERMRNLWPKEISERNLIHGSRTKLPEFFGRYQKYTKSTVISDFSNLIIFNSNIRDNFIGIINPPMSLQFPLFIIFCFIVSISTQVTFSLFFFYSSQTSTDNDDDFIKTIIAILENKQTLSDSPSSLSTFAYWQGSFWNTSVRSFSGLLTITFSYRVSLIFLWPMD